MAQTIRTSLPKEERKDLEGINYEIVTHSKIIANERTASHALERTVIRACGRKRQQRAAARSFRPLNATPWGRPQRRFVSSTTKPFQVTSDGVLMERRGEGWNDQRRFSRYYVKYSIKPRDGMYLGRCFLLDDQEVGTLWREYKKHPRMMCNVQDDDFALPFR